MSKEKLAECRNCEFTLSQNDIDNGHKYCYQCRLDGEAIFEAVKNLAKNEG